MVTLARFDGSSAASARQGRWRPGGADCRAADLQNMPPWSGDVRLGTSLMWDSPEKSWYRRVPP